MKRLNTEPNLSKHPDHSPVDHETNIPDLFGVFSTDEQPNEDFEVIRERAKKNIINSECYSPFDPT